MMVIRPILAYVRELLSGVLQPGDAAIDGTVGNGYDTQFLAECVGESGHVFGFDIQEQAFMSGSIGTGKPVLSFIKSACSAKSGSQKEYRIDFIIS